MPRCVIARGNFSRTFEPNYYKIRGSNKYFHRPCITKALNPFNTDVQLPVAYIGFNLGEKVALCIYNTS